MALQNVEAVIEAIKKIDKDKLSEREFFSHGLEAISQLGYEGIHIDNQYDYRRVSQALKEAGFDDYEIWKEAKLAKGEPVLEGKDFSLDRGDVEIAASWIATFIRDHDGANYVIERSIAKSGKTSNVEVWLEANKKMIELENQETKELEIEIDEQDKGPEIETQIKEELPEIEIPGGMDLDDAITLLFKQPNDVKAIFNGHEITSEMTEDEIYREVLGKTKEEIELAEASTKETKEELPEIKIPGGMDLDDVITLLFKQPNDVKAIFNGHEITSEMTEDEIYREVLGKTKEEIELAAEARTLKEVKDDQETKIADLLKAFELDTQTKEDRQPEEGGRRRRPRRGAGIGEGGHDDR